MMNPNATRCECTPEMALTYDICERCDAKSFYSEIFKDEFGVRPLFDGDESLAEIRAMTRGLIDGGPWKPVVPSSGEGWCVITDDPEGLLARLEAQAP